MRKLSAGLTGTAGGETWRYTGVFAHDGIVYEVTLTNYDLTTPNRVRVWCRVWKSKGWKEVVSDIILECDLEDVAGRHDVGGTTPLLTSKALWAVELAQEIMRETKSREGG